MRSLLESRQTDRQPRQEAAGWHRAQAPRVAEDRGQRPSQDGLVPRTENFLFIHTQVSLLPGHKSRTENEQNLPQEAGQSTHDCPPAPGPRALLGDHATCEPSPCPPAPTPHRHPAAAETWSPHSFDANK